MLNDLDEFLEDAARLVILHQEASASLIQRKLKLGYNRAGRIIDQLESLGVIGSFNGVYKRQVLITDENLLENLLKNIKEEKTIEFEFHINYYNLLVEFSKRARIIRSKLIKNEILIDKMGLKKSDILTTIPIIIIYELCQILYKFKGSNLDPNSLEATGLLLLANKLIFDIERDFLEEGYKSVSILYEEGVLTKPTSSVLNIGKSNSISINISKDDSELVWIDELTKKLPILIALKHEENSLFEEYALFLYNFANVISKADGSVSTNEELLLRELYQILNDPLPQPKNQLKITSNHNETLDNTLQELNSLIGLNEVKSEIKTLINFIRIQKARAAKGYKSSALSYHIIFTGNPGTGKTTVARIIAKIYKSLGVLKEGQLVETDRSGLIAEYVGQTAIKVNKTVDSAMNGVLFIDEAYSIINNSSNQDSFGKEAVATLIKRMEDDRENLVVVLAGYTKEMKEFIDSNPGIKSRFNRYINFNDYNPEELVSIFEIFCKNLDYKLAEDARIKLNEIFKLAYENRDESFGNGRYARNTFEKSMEMHANRIASIADLTDEILTVITVEDIPD
ncbi:DNA translocase FtsK [Fulvivirgaceae bacterium LMO-SS25]